MTATPDQIRAHARELFPGARALNPEQRKLVALNLDCSTLDVRNALRSDHGQRGRPLADPGARVLLRERDLSRRVLEQARALAEEDGVSLLAVIVAAVESGVEVPPKRRRKGNGPAR